jgi:hypothetical protein
MPKKTIVRIVVSILLAFLTVGAIGLMDKLPYSRSRDVLSDALKFPAYLISGLLAPGGIHGSHPMLWIYSGVVTLYGTYAVVWFAVLSFFDRRRSSTH